MPKSSLTLIVDGIWRRPGRFKRWRAELAAVGLEAVEYDYNSSGRISIDKLGRDLAARITEEKREVNLIGFSMGGLVVRAAHFAVPDLPIRRVAFLNSPHRGSWLAHALPIAAVRQMRPRSAFLRDLNAADWNVPTIAVYSPGDAMVLPGTSGRFDRATSLICNHVPAHIWPVVSRSIRQRVVEFLAAPNVEAYSAANA